MTKWKRYFSLFFVRLIHLFLLSLICLSLYHPPISVSLFFWFDTPISQRFHAWGIPNGSALTTNRSIFIDLKVAGLENCLTIFKTPQISRQHSLSPVPIRSQGLHMLLCHTPKPFMKLLISNATQIHFSQPITLNWIGNGELQNMSKGAICCIFRSLKHCWHKDLHDML